MTEAKSESAFWRFSLAFYAREGVAPACLVLQDEAGVDVNLMLFLLFLADGGRAVTRDEVARLDADVDAWRATVVEPLRGVRRRLKQGVGTVPATASETLRNQIKKVELEAERLEQHRLESHASTIGIAGADRADAAQRNLAALSAFLGRLPDKEVQILLAAFTEAPPSPH